MLSPLLETPNVSVLIEELITVVVEFRGAVTESTEKSLYLRKTLGVLLEDLRTKALAVAQRRSVCVPRLVVCGPRQSGRTSLVNFILHRRATQLAEEGSSRSGGQTSARGERGPRATSGVALLGELSGVSSILSTASNVRREGMGLSVDSPYDDGAERVPPAPQTQTSRRRLLRCMDEEVTPHDGQSFHFVAPSLQEDWQPLGGGDPGMPPELSTRNVTLLPGAFEQTVFDRVMCRTRSAGLSQSPISGNREPSHPDLADTACAEGAQQTKVAWDGVLDEGLRASLWILYERSNTGGEGDVVWNEDRRASRSRRVPEHAFAEIYFVTIPCDVVGTERLPACVAPLFGTYSRNCKHACKDKSTCVCDCDVGVLQIRQLISDTVFYVLTFSDAITTRDDGVLSLDECLRQRPPPLATNLRHAVDLFIAQMRRVCGVDIAPWQVITFSSVTSHVTRELLTTIAEKRMWRDSVDRMESPAEPSQHSKYQLKPMSISLVSSTPSFCVLGIPTALYDYCDAVFGERFKERRTALLVEQVERIAFEYATGSTWFTSGANQLMRTLRLFEWSAILHYLHRIALSLRMWSRQLMLTLPKVRTKLQTYIRGLQKDLCQAKCRGKLAEDAIQELQKYVSPHEISHDIQLHLQERFEEFTIRFWQRLLALIDIEGNHNNNTGADELFEYPPALVEARERLLLQYRVFVKFYVSARYENQVAQVLRLLAEKEGVTGSALNIPGSIPAVDHIPFVAKNTRPLKFTMEGELTLQLSRLNTEVINYFMAELDYAFGDFVAFCDEQRDATVSRLSRVLQPLLHAQSSRGVADISRAQVVLSEVSRLSLVELQPPAPMEAFVTGLRGALCEDQILLILRHRGILARDKGEGTTATGGTHSPGRRTVAYVERMDRESASQHPHRMEMVPAQYRCLVLCGRLPAGAFWASSHVERVAPVREEWIRRSSPSCANANPSSGGTEESGEEESYADISPIFDIKKMRGRRITLKESDMPLNRIWFVIDVWREALSAMSFRSWMQLRSAQYGKLLNCFCGSFMKGHYELSTEIAKEAKCLEEVLQRKGNEEKFLNVDTPETLQRISNTATCVAGKLTCMRGHMFATALKENKE